LGGLTKLYLSNDGKNRLRQKLRGKRVFSETLRKWENALGGKAKKTSQFSKNDATRENGKKAGSTPKKETGLSPKEGRRDRSRGQRKAAKGARIAAGLEKRGFLERRP